VGGRGVKDGVAELKVRSTGEERKIPLDQVVKAVNDFLEGN
jgi:hypothetical protein